MAETLVETRYCDSCGADVRAGSLFCYSCGGSTESAVNEPKKKKKKNKTDISNAWLREDLVEDNNLQTMRLDDKTVKSDIEEPATEEPIVEEMVATESAVEETPIKEIDEKAVSNPPIKKEEKLKSAANMRRKPKVIQPKTVKVVWEESETSPSGWFILFALVLVILAGVIFFFAMYLK